MPTITFYVSGMHCASCSVAIEDRIKRLSGVSEVRVNYASEQAYISFDEGAITRQDIMQEIQGLGYKPIFADKKDPDQDIEKTKELADLRVKVIISLILSGLLFIGAMVPFAPGWLQNHWVLWLLATPVQFWIGARYYKSMWIGIKNRMANMDTLIALGTSVAYFYSVFVLFFNDALERAGIPTHVYFEASAMIITFILLGKYLEIRAKGRASTAIKQLMGLQPKNALVKQRGDSDWQEISIERVVVGDVILIKPGGQVPVDGVIISGQSTIDESMVTGESMPVFKKEGAEVVGGTLSVTGSFEMKTTKVGEQTMLSSIVRMVQNAQSSKAPVQKLVDRISGVFVPVVIVLSIISFGIWFMFGPAPQFLYAMISVVSVLIIACPCALGLATPTSLMVGMGRGAQQGILIKDALSLEVAGKIQVVVFDKTGTLTAGKPSVQGFRQEKNINEIMHKIKWSVPGGVEVQDFVSAVILAVEQLSNHPISHAAVRYLSTEKIIKYTFEVKKSEALSGLGVRGFIDSHRVLIGSRQLLEQEGIAMPDEVDACAVQWSKEAKSVSFVAFDDQLVAYFCVADSVRPEVPNAIARLKDMGVRSIMITGDNPLSAKAVADSIGIEQFFAEVKPADKAKKIQDLKDQGLVVAMVGDGINDAPALATADVGIAMGTGTDVALETAHVALLRNDISLVPKVIALSRATITNIRQNLVWAFGYNIILIPVAMGLLYPLFGIMLNPMIAGAAMAFSSLSVVFNALRLKSVKL